MEDKGPKRVSAGGGGPPEKRSKGEAEDTNVYSERIKKKMQSNSRTGQACDRCKERKMKCDSNVDGCQPCQSKDMICKSTDRITGQAHERGETARLKRENAELRAQVQAYQQQLGLQSPAQHPVPGPYQAYMSSNGYSSNPPVPQQMPSVDRDSNAEGRRANNPSGPHTGPIYQTNVDIVDGEIDIGNFNCPDMEETIKLSQETMTLSQAIVPLDDSQRRALASALATRKPEKPPMPSRDETLQYIDSFQNVIAPYVPIVHGPTFRRQVIDFYDDHTSFDDKPAEIAMITVVLAIFAHQMAIRNPSMRKEKLAESNRLYSYALGFYQQVLLSDTLPAMQALTLFLVHVRNMPKPGISWTLSSMLLVRAVELNYHRSSKGVILPPDQQNPIAIELRKRVFWSILGIQVTIAVKMSRPMMISPRDIDMELPHPILDSEITGKGLLSRSGNCDFWGHIFLSKKLPLLMELYKNFIRLRKSGPEYTRDLKQLDARISRWRREWDEDTAHQIKDGSFKMATHLIDAWYSEFRIILHHPSLCTSQVAEVHERNLDICIEASRTLLRNVVAMVQDFRGADFTWHFVSGYVLAMGIAIHIYHKRKELLNTETFNKMKLELHGWLFVMKSADHFMNSGGHLFRFFQPRVQRCLEDAQDVLTASEALRNGYHPAALPAAVPQQAMYNTQPPSAAAPFATEPGTYARPRHSYPPPQAATSMYPEAMGFQAPCSDQIVDNDDTDAFAVAQGNWPASIVQYGNAGL